MLLRPAEFTHVSDKFEFITKEFGASGAGRSLRRCRCPYHFVGLAAVANQLAAAWMWLAGAMPLNTVHSNSLLYFSVFCETHDLVWEIISVSEQRMKNCIVKIIDNVFEKRQRWVISFKGSVPPSNEHPLYFFLGKEVTVFTFGRNKSLVRTWNNYFFVMFDIGLNSLNKNLIRFLPKRLDNEKYMP